MGKQIENPNDKKITVILNGVALQMPLRIAAIYARKGKIVLKDDDLEAANKALSEYRAGRAAAAKQKMLETDPTRAQTELMLEFLKRQIEAKDATAEEASDKPRKKKNQEESNA